MLVRANLRGVDTHGVSRLRIYARLLRDGVMNPVPDTRIEEAAGILHFRADRGFGQVCGPRAVDAALQWLQGQATCTVVLHDTGHLGALGVLAVQLAEAGILGLVMQNGPPIMALPGAAAAAIGNNPLAFAAPVPDGPPLVVDIATSEVAFGRVIDAVRTKQPLEPGWALDAQGQPTVDAQAALRGGMLTPAAAHKGIGLAMMVEALAGSLSGVRPEAMSGATLPGGFGGFLYAINPALAAGGGFAEHVRQWIGTYHAAGPDMRYPGERAAACEAERERDGVPLPQAVLDELDKLAVTLDLAPLPP